MAAHQHASGHDADHHGHHGIGRYIVIWAILIAFSVLTVVTGSMDLGTANIYLAMAIATTKATLVLLFFMHLWEETAVNRLIFITSVLFALVMLVGIFGDLVTRAPSILPNGGPLPVTIHGDRDDLLKAIEAGTYGKRPSGHGEAAPAAH
ncbi:MAG TPA: cytochrome C oxidase subunit IV family protein [Polyangia bacterium]